MAERPGELVERLTEQIRMGIYGGSAYQATAIKALDQLTRHVRDAAPNPCDRECNENGHCSGACDAD